jgi:non-specific protein-tyrosine kinase
VLGTVLAGGTAYVVSKNTAPVYRATTTLLISQSRTPAALDYTAILTSERLAKTYAELLTKRPVLEEAARRLGLEHRPPPIAVKIHWRELAQICSDCQVPGASLLAMPLGA